MLAEPVDGLKSKKEAAVVLRLPLRYFCLVFDKHVTYRREVLVSHERLFIMYVSATLSGKKFLRLKHRAETCALLLTVHLIFLAFLK